MVSVNPAGDGLYDLNLLAVGTVSYKSTCSTCPVTETIYTYLSIPVTSNEGIVVTANNESCSLNGISCNCNTSSSINIVASFTVETKIAAAEASDESGD